MIFLKLEEFLTSYLRFYFFTTVLNFELFIRIAYNFPETYVLCNAKGS